MSNETKTAAVQPAAPGKREKALCRRYLPEGLRQRLQGGH